MLLITFWLLQFYPLLCLPRSTSLSFTLCDTCFHPNRMDPNSTFTWDLFYRKKNTVHYYGFYNGIVFILNKHFNEIFRWNANNCLVLDTRDMIRLIFKMKPIFFLTFQFFIFTFCITLWFFYFRWTLQVEALNLFLLVYWIIGKLLVTNYTDEY